MTAPGPTGGTPRPHGRSRLAARDAAMWREFLRLWWTGGLPSDEALTILADRYGLTPATVRRIVARGRRPEAATKPQAAPHGAIERGGDP